MMIAHFAPAIDARAIIRGLLSIADDEQGRWVPPGDALGVVDGALSMVRHLPVGMGLHRLHHLRGALLAGGPLTESAVGACETAAAAIRRRLASEGAAS